MDDHCEDTTNSLPPDATKRSQSGLMVAVAALVISVTAAALASTALLLPDARKSSAPSTDSDDVRSQREESNAGSPETEDLTLPPVRIPALIDQVSESVVWVECYAGVGTGWVIDTAAEPNVRQAFREEYDPNSTALVVTAEHVIRSCVNRQERPDVFVGERPVDASLLNWRKKTDIAVLAIEADLPGLPATVRTPQAAWAMSIGFPWEFEKTVPLIGHVIDQDATGLLLQMVVQPGNSGSPVVNSKGEAMGTVVASLGDEGEDYSLGWTSAVPIEAMCEAMFLCDEVSVTTPRVTPEVDN